MDRSHPEGSSTSPPRRSRRSSPSGRGSSTSVSPGDGARLGSASVGTGGLGAAAVRDLAVRHGIRPTKSLGQSFLIDPNLARAIAADAGVGPGDRVVEIGAGLGSLTVALARTGAEITAIEFDRKLIPALEESVTGLSNVTIVHADATRIDWEVDFGGEDEWTACANLPYNVAVPIILEMLAEGSAVKRFVLMVQREVGQRLTALAGADAYGAVSVRIAYRARASLVRRVPPDVFWPRPAVESVIVKLERRDAPAVDVDPARLWRVIDAGFGQKRKTMRNGLRRLGLSADEAAGVLARSGIESQARAEELTIEELASIAENIGP